MTARAFYMRGRDVRYSMKYFIHTVQKGENLRRIARRYGVPERELAAANNVDGEQFEGMKLEVVKRDGTYYTVKPFDTLAKIAAAHGTSAQKIAALNGLEGGAVFLGQMLYIE